MSSHVAADGAPAAPTARRRASSLSSVAQKFVHEVRETCTASWRQPFRFASYFRAWRRRRVSGRAFSRAQLALGRSMYTAGIDDGESGVRMHSLDDQGRGTEAATPSGKALDGRRAELLIRLAASALAEEAPLPGAEAEYRGAREAQAALRKHDSELTAAKALLIPRDKIDWCRVAVGYATVGFFLLLAIVLARVLTDSR